PPAILLRESFRDGDKVRTRTLANLTSWAPERIEALRRALKGEFDGFTGELQPVCGPIFAVLFALKQLAERVGLLQVLGSARWASRRGPAVVRRSVCARRARSRSRRGSSALMRVPLQPRSGVGAGGRTPWGRRSIGGRDRSGAPLPRFSYNPNNPRLTSTHSP